MSQEITESWNITVGDTTLTTTSEHPFWVIGKGWVLAKNLVVGDLFETSDTPVSIEKIEIKQEPNTVYNFSVQDYHTYYVSDLRILTHNSVCTTINPYNINNVKDRWGRYTTTKGSNSKILAAELEAATLHKPVDIPDVENWAAHHIIAAGANHTNSDILRAQQILATHNIDINSAANGVWLPKKPGSSTVDIDGTFVSTHNGYHVGSYFEEVIKRLEPVKDDKTRVLEVINEIREDLLTGKIKLGNLKN